mgnify:CR=1 FL=1
MNVVSTGQMYEIDKRAQTDYLIPSAAILEQAGYQIACALRHELAEKDGAKIAVIAGHGNNAIDALIAARYLSNWGFSIKVFVLSTQDSLNTAMQLYIAMLQEFNVEIIYMGTEFVWDRFSIAIRMCDIILDGILGIGFVDALTANFEKAVDIINKIPVKTVSIDIPSGCRADTGEIPTIAVKADLTLTICLPKQGLFLSPTNSHIGQLKVLEINIPRALTEQVSNTQLLTEDLIRPLLPERNAHLHKYQVGKATIFAGNIGMVGAAFLASTACMRIGAGLVDTFTMQATYPILAGKMTEALVYPIGEDTPAQALQKFISSTKSSQSVLVGPGLGNNIYTKDFLPYILSNVNSKNLVLDADALSAAFAHPELIKKYSGDIIITPHAGEFSRLINVNAATIETNKIELARKFAISMNITVVLKGPVSIIALPTGEAYINNCALTNMASAGMGDVLAGMITGLIAQGVSSKNACLIAVYLHTYTAQTLQNKGLDVGMLATDLVNELPLAINYFKKSNKI